MTITYNTTELLLWVYKNKDFFQNFILSNKYHFSPEKAHKKGRATSPAYFSHTTVSYV